MALVNRPQSFHYAYSSRSEYVQALFRQKIKKLVYENGGWKERNRRV